MKTQFKIGDKITWNSEAGKVSGTIIKILTKDFDYKNYIMDCIEEDSQ